LYHTLTRILDAVLKPIFMPRGAPKAHEVCHENVTQDAENTGNCEANDGKRRRKQIARSCPNLLNPFD
jgi:hypothetical protein